MMRRPEDKLNIQRDEHVRPVQIEKPQELLISVVQACQCFQGNAQYLLEELVAGWWYRKTLALLLAQWLAICRLGQMMNRSLQHTQVISPFLFCCSGCGQQAWSSCLTLMYRHEVADCPTWWRC